MTTKHQHSSSIFDYANDAAKTDKPWLLWEYSESGDNWWPLQTHPTWSTMVDYRRHRHHEWILNYLNGVRLQFTHEKTDVINDGDWFNVDSEHQWDAEKYRLSGDIEKITVGDTQFESWISENKFPSPYNKQSMRDAYWAGYQERESLTIADKPL